MKKILLLSFYMLIAQISLAQEVLLADTSWQDVLKNDLEIRSIYDQYEKYFFKTHDFFLEDRFIIKKDYEEIVFCSFHERMSPSYEARFIRIDLNNINMVDDSHKGYFIKDSLEILNLRETIKQYNPVQKFYKNNYLDRKENVFFIFLYKKTNYMTIFYNYL